MSNCREILTLQFGNYANYVGTHWWNIQESSFNYDPFAEPSEVNHDILYREGKNLKGEVTYTPRLLLVDLKGVLKHHSTIGELYETPLQLDQPESFNNIKTAINWDSDSVEVLKSDPIEKHEFIKDLTEPSTSDNSKISENKSYDFTKSVQTWTDFMYSRYHPRSINLINNFEYSNVSTKFDTFTLGRQMWRENNFGDEFGDKIRQYLEECDMFQGFQFLFDCTDGFSGLTAECLEHLKEEYSYAIFAVPMVSPHAVDFQNADSPMSDSIRLINIAMCYSNLAEQSSLFVPLSTMSKGWRSIQQPRQFSQISYDSENLYQTSAVLASFLDTISLRYRVKNPCGSNYLPGFCSDLTNYGRLMAGGGIGLPFKMSPTEDLIDCLDKQINENLFTEISPNTEIGTDRVIQSVVVRGIPKNRIKRPLNKAKDQMKKAAYRCENVSEMFQLYFQCKNYSSLSHVTSIQSPMTIKTPYPHEVFNQNINFEGFLSEFQLNEPQKILSIPTLSTIQTSNKLADTLESLHRETSRIKLQKIHRFKETGMEMDDFKEMLNSLLEFKDNYDETFEL